MPVPLEPGDRKFLMTVGGLLLVVLLIVIAVAPPPPAESSGFPSSYSPASGGAKAAYVLLKDLGYDVERWEKPATDLPSESSGTVLILAEPFFPAGAGERQAIHAFVRNGGLVLAAGPMVANWLPEGGALDHEPKETEWREYRAVVPSPLTRAAPQVTLQPQARWQMAHFAHLGLYAEDVNSVVVGYSHGQGQVIWWAAATPLTNAGIRKPGNLNLLLNSLGAPQNKRILWDEYYHGQRGTLWSYFASTPLPWGLAQLGLLALALLVTFARRAGPLRAPLPESRLSPLEFVETLGDLYHRAHAASAAVGIAWQRFRHLLTRRLGLASSASLAQLHQSVRDCLGWKEPGFYETLQRAERAAGNAALTDAEALQIVQSLEHYAQLLQLKPRNPEGKRAWPKT